jgi:hypothetical protein
VCVCMSTVMVDSVFCSVHYNAQAPGNHIKADEVCPRKTFFYALHAQVQISSCVYQPTQRTNLLLQTHMQLHGAL